MRRTPHAFVISLTPFDTAERLDEEALRRHLRRLAATGIGVYVGGGGSGEAYTLRPAERRRVLEIAVEELRGTVPVRAMGIEPRTAEEMVEFGALVAEVGLDAMQVYSLDIGHLGQPSPAEMERYLTDVLGDISVPAVLSTHFSVGYFFPVTLLAEMTERFSNVIGINVTNPDINYLVQLTSALDERIEVYTGLMTQALAALSLGASGYLASEANLAPRLCMRVIERFRAGDLDGTMAAYERLLRLSEQLYRGGGSMRATKAALGLLGLPGGIPRRPRLPLTDVAAIERLGWMLREFDVAGEEVTSTP